MERKIRNIITKPLILLFILSITYIIFLASFRVMLYDEQFYNTQFEENNVYSNLDKNITDHHLNSLFLFFQDKNNLDSTDFNEKEKSHLKDVKALIDQLLLAFYTLIILDICLIFIFIRYMNIKLKKIFYMISIGSAITLFIITTLYIASSFFTHFFTGFHIVFFEKNSWLFSMDALLIMMFPLEFFYNFFYKIIHKSLIISLILTLAGLLQYICSKIHHKKYHK